MYSYIFPDLTDWFEIEAYREHNKCHLLEIKMKKGLSSSQVEEFCIEFAKYICSVRCSSERLYDEMVDAIDKKMVLSAPSKTRLQNEFYNGFIRDEEYKKTGDYKKSFDYDGIKGYLGEALYYLVREKHVEDENISIEPRRPKCIAKTSGIDFLEVRKDGVGYYFIVGEVKTTSNSYSTRNQEVIDSFINRINRNFSEIYSDLKEQDDGTDAGYTAFLEDMINIFYSYIGSDRKRFSGVFNYGYSGRRISAASFSTWKDQPFEIDDNPLCRKLKLVGIYNIDDVLIRVRDIIWNVL